MAASNGSCPVEGTPFLLWIGCRRLWLTRTLANVTMTNPEENFVSSTIKVAIATPLEPALRHLLTDVDPSVDLLVDDALLPPQRFPGDHVGDPDFRRTHAQQTSFDQLLSQADVFYGIPDTRPAALAPAVRANPDLRWVQTMAAGGGAEVKAAGLTREELERVLFTTSAGVHGGTLAEFAIFGILAGAKDLPVCRLSRAPGGGRTAGR